MLLTLFTGGGFEIQNFAHSLVSHGWNRERGEGTLTKSNGGMLLLVGMFRIWKQVFYITKEQNIDDSSRDSKEMLWDFRRNIRGDLSS